ncbi:pancreatic triacylglycerol lipase-like [Eriocheir sinensis]|uniref:pancreatic triacylglycerol lipase-like n=1 Tax=Eriocheir sinensis TaxID=95602 RepID=UPI0021C8957D|nr:pancreatic triacylglycerol lipase-like [Eriocheir sinensis]
MARQALLCSLFIVVAAASSWPDLRDPYNDRSNHLHTFPEPLLGNLSDIRFLLWTRSNPGDDDHYRLLPGDAANLDQSPLDPALPTYVMYHGFSDFGLCGWILQAKTELLSLYECNVLSVDWQTLVLSPWYDQGVKNAYRTANYTASMLDWLAAEVGLLPAQLHITGHSLGAHTAGLTAKYVTAGTVARVTGLDPAGPAFYTQPPERRIDKTDADFVDILHTNSGSLPEGCIALFKPVGHVDFYPNGGRHQPGCVVIPGNEDNILDLLGGCSHARVTEIWVESIVALPPAEAFTSWPCTDWDTFFAGNCSSCGQGCLDMGFHVQRDLEGTYFLRTNPYSPFALGDTQ